MTNQLDEDEAKERLWTLYEHDTITSAAEELGIQQPTLSVWAGRNIAGYRSRTRRMPKPDLPEHKRRKLLASLNSMMDDIDTLLDADTDAGAERRLERLRSEVEWFSDQIRYRANDE